MGKQHGPVANSKDCSDTGYAAGTGSNTGDQDLVTRPIRRCRGGDGRATRARAATRQSVGGRKAAREAGMHASRDGSRDSLCRVSAVVHGPGLLHEPSTEPAHQAATPSTCFDALPVEVIDLVLEYLAWYCLYDDVDGALESHGNQRLEAACSLHASSARSGVASHLRRRRATPSPVQTTTARAHNAVSGGKRKCDNNGESCAEKPRKRPR